MQLLLRGVVTREDIASAQGIIKDLSQFIWGPDENLAANKQGWGIIEVATTVPPNLVSIGRIEPSEAPGGKVENDFVDDDETIDFIKTKAAQGDPLATRACLCVLAHNPGEAQALGLDAALAAALGPTQEDHSPSPN